MKWTIIEIKQICCEENAVIQMYNAKYHCKNWVLQFYQENNIKVINWPSYSPYLNLIKNIWSIIKNKLKGRKF